MVPSNDSRVHAYVQLVRSAESLHAGISRGLAIEGLSSSQFSAMKVLRIHGKLAQRDIAKHILKTCGNITILVDNLESMGLVIRDRDTKDRRISYVSLTDKGKETFDELYPGHIARILEGMSALSGEECRDLMRLLQKLAPEIVNFECEPVLASA